MQEYKDAFKGLKLSYVDDNMSSCDGAFYYTSEQFKSDLTGLLDKGLRAITTCFDESMTKISKTESENSTLYNYKIKEVESVFTTIVTTFYKNKVLSIMPDIVHTLETSRFSRAAVIIDHFQAKKHKMRLNRGLRAFQANLTGYYMDECKFNSCNLLIIV